MQKVLVTGTGGFIGYFTAKKLLEQGYAVIGVDILNEYYDVTLKQKRLSELETFDAYSHYTIDFTDFEALDAVVVSQKPAKIIHLAAQAGVRYSLENPWAYEQANCLGTLNILETARRHDIKRVVLASSSSVYGGNTKVPFSENDPVDKPVSLYAASKKYNELQAHVYNHLYGLSVVCLRFFTVYGPYMRPDLAIFKFVKAYFIG